MARLIVEALAEDTVAAPGNRQPLYIIASVTAASGNPTTGLAAANFKIQAEIVGPGGSEVQFGDWFIEPRPGVYHIQMLPIRDLTWKQGVYIFSVTVQRGTDRGQTLTQVLMD
jgi:hypothetical protein